MRSCNPTLGDRASAASATGLRPPQALAGELRVVRGALHAGIRRSRRNGSAVNRKPPDQSCRPAVCYVRQAWFRLTRRMSRPDRRLSTDESCTPAVILRGGARTPIATCLRAPRPRPPQGVCAPPPVSACPHPRRGGSKTRPLLGHLGKAGSSASEGTIAVN